MIEERFSLSLERIETIQEEQVLGQPYAVYFKTIAAWIGQAVQEYITVESGQIHQMDMKSLQDRNEALYQDILGENYERSYSNPAYCASIFGAEIGALFAFLATEMRALIEYAYEQQKEEMTIRMELFLEIYHAFYFAGEQKEPLPNAQQIKDICYWFISDYSETETEKRIRCQLDPEEDFAFKIIMKSDLNDLRYLYYFGEYITDSEIRTAKKLNAMTEEEIAKMADTYTEGFRIGFINGNKDITKKKVVNIRYCLGFERVIRKAIQNFEKMGLRPTIYRASGSVFHRKGTHKIGYYGAIANKQFEFDHKEDDALFLDRLLMNRKLEVLKAAFELNKELAFVHAGPAVMEIFGETPFVPAVKKEACSYSKEQQKIAVEYASKASSLTNEYIKGEERSFTIIAFPVPEIGEQYEEIFEEIVKINTLDYKLYEGIQQTIIDALDGAEHVLIKGSGKNKTDLKVSLRSLKDPTCETVFENCVADVNIPVGEVFTSPVLKGTNGILYVSRVFLNELEYLDLEIVFQDGMIASYTCSNFDEEAENKKYIMDNVLFHHETLPLGEFAIGTNTTAYVVARKYGIEDKLPILIAEKMGPHFAVGDTCYSHSEDVKVYNPNKKEIIARDNEVSILRKSDPAKAYLNCHTDITIPYDELESIIAVKETGEQTQIIYQGRFVLPGCEALNLPFEE